MLRLVSLAVIAAFAFTVAYGSDAASEQHRRAEMGKHVYEAQCASCHGARAEGVPNWREPDAGGEMPAPPHDAQGHTWKHGDGMLYRIVHDGWRDAFNKTQRLTMPPFGDKLSPNEIEAVIEYLKTLWTPQQRRFQRDESRKEPFPPEARERPDNFQRKGPRP